MHHTVVLIPGDGIGPEVADAAKRVLQAAGANLQWVERDAGMAAVQRGADSVLPHDTVQAILEHGVALKGPCTTPIGGGFSSVNVALRKKLNLYGAVRPVRSLKGVHTRYENVDLIVVRENTEGLYSGIENIITPGVITSLKVATEEACRRIARFAFNYAITRGRKKVTCFHKANIMKLSDGLFIQCAREEHEMMKACIRHQAGKGTGHQALGTSSPPSAQSPVPNAFPEYNEMIIDAACMRIVQDPSQFDVILCENLYGDLISDLCAGLVGGLGVTPGANFGEKHAVFEAVHGSAPDIAGQNKANPLALIMSAVMMLRHLAATRNDPSCTAAADKIRDAYNDCLVAGEKTRDLGGSLGTREFADAVIARLAV